MNRRIIYLLGFLALMLSCSVPATAAELRLSIAASLTDALKELAADFRQQHPDLQLLTNFASSGALARQIVAGAPADVYISANPKWMAYLQQQGLIAAEAERVLVHNSLVFVCRQPETVNSLRELPQLSRIALGSPSSVPAGKYAEQALTAAGLYTELQAAGILVPAKDVRQALLYADRGEVDGAFVYRTDALLAQQAKICFSVPTGLYPQITYPAALLKNAADNQTALEFFAYLFSPAAQQVFDKYGFNAVIRER